MIHSETKNAYHQKKLRTSSAAAKQNKKGKRRKTAKKGLNKNLQETRR